MHIMNAFNPPPPKKNILLYNCYLLPQKIKKKNNNFYLHLDQFFKMLVPKYKQYTSNNEKDGILKFQLFINLTSSSRARKMKQGPVKHGVPPK